jgi:hypothetical protein
VVWGHSDQPYTHTVQYDDGTTHSYCTLERPGLTFDSQGLLTHINLAADLVTQDEGCASRGKGCVDVSWGRGCARVAKTRVTTRVTLSQGTPPFFRVTRSPFSPPLHPPSMQCKYNDHAGTVVIALGA